MITNRIVSLDIAKAICIILVVVGHYIPDNSPEWYKLIHDVIYTFHMPLFMFASGYVYIATKKDIGYGDFLVKKIKRLMIPYFTTSVIVISIKMLTQGNMSVDNPVTWTSYFKMFYLPEAGYFLWFIWALWWMFVLLPIFKTKRSRTILFLISLIIHYIPMALPKEFCIAECKNMIVFFTLGVFAFENGFIHKFLKDYSINKVILAIMAFVVCEYLYFSDLNTDVLKTTLNILLPYIGIFFVIEISKLICKYQEVGKNHILMIVSMSSYIIYLFHTTFEGFAKAVFRKLPLDNNLWYVFLPEAVVVIAVGVIIPMLLHRYVLKRWQLTRTLFGL